MPTVTQLVASLGGSSLLTPRPRLTPLQAAASAKVLPPLAALQLGGRKGLSFLVWKNRAQAMVTGCPGADPDGRAGAPVSRAMVPSPPLPGSRLASWPPGRGKGAEGLLGASQAENWAAGTSQTTLHKQHLFQPPGLRAEKQCQMVPNTG